MRNKGGHLDRGLQGWARVNKAWSGMEKYTFRVSGNGGATVSLFIAGRCSRRTGRLGSGVYRRSVYSP